MRQIDLIKLYSQMRCLVVDDMPDIRVAISGMLRVFGVKDVDVAASAEQAVEACANKQYHMVVCDYNLGAGQDGQQILEELRYRNYLHNTSIYVMITAESSREMVLGALEYQPDDYVTKPITQALLRQRLDRVIIRHHELFGIKQAMDEKDYAKADRLCTERLNDNTSYRNMCLQIKAEMNLRLENFQRSEEIYTGILAERPVLWAKLGLGKTLLAKKEFEEAEKNLKEVIAQDRRVVEAHDLLADSYIARGESQLAQRAMQNAAEVSPKSVMRQRRLAELARVNKDTEVCLDASRKVLKTARNSCFESPSDYFNLANELVELTKAGTSGADKYVKETFEVLQRLEKRPFYDVSADLATNTLKSRSLMNNNKSNDAAAYLEKAKKIYTQKKDRIKPEAGLELAQTLLATGDKSAADQVLNELVEMFPNNLEFVAKVDAMSDAPKSQAGRKQVADMTRAGIEFYEQKQFLEAIRIFEKAIELFPGHVGLNLNLVQSVIAEARHHGGQPGFAAICRTAMGRIAKIDEADPQYKRYQHIAGQVNELFGLDV